MRYSLSLIVILLSLSLPTIAQAKAWRGILPLKSTRADVERLLGLPGKHGRYQFDKERAYIEYAGAGPCCPVNGCLCFVPEDIVISINVELEVEMRFSTLKIDLKKYKKYVSPQNPALISYSNDEEGIIYTVEDDDVTAIEYLPTAKDCQDVMRRAKRAGVKSSRRKTRCLSLLGHSSLSALFVLHNERQDNTDNVLLRASGQARHILKNLPVLAGRPGASLHRHALAVEDSAPPRSPHPECQPASATR